MMVNAANLPWLIAPLLSLAGCGAGTQLTTSPFLALDFDSKANKAVLTFVNSSTEDLEVAGLSIGETVKVPIGFTVAIFQNGDPIVAKRGFEDGYWSPLFMTSESKYMWDRFVTVPAGERVVAQVSITEMFECSGLPVRQPNQQLRIRWTGIAKTDRNVQKVVRYELFIGP